MPKVVYNSEYGGFGLSVQAIEWLAAKGHPQSLAVMAQDPNPSNWYLHEVDRDDPLVVECIEELGKDANGECARLRVFYVAPGYNWDIDEYDGLEKVKTWPRSVRSRS